MITKPFEAIVVGTSAGGLQALRSLLNQFPEDWALPILVVQHLSPQSQGDLAGIIADFCRLKVKEAEDKEPVQSGIVYLAPPDYHLLVEPNRRLSLSVDNKVNFSRPSIDVLFESAAETYRQALIGVVLTGANSDGAIGALAIQARGGEVVVQDPNEAFVRTMPEAAIAKVPGCHVIGIAGMGPWLIERATGKGPVHL